ncbi:hypothetical protein DM02DRAFT_655647 [Periconia macrospinosa]|uniref:Uncharacterized protein n=1 Tax=Periconia macrospinosa TaxID=97972 RepID=A0A2V1DSK6_9PLEO|nr:hypothetical protein DM02DRAFT_655647 [Periconia macrospinosa]
MPHSRAHRNIPYPQTVNRCSEFCNFTGREPGTSADACLIARSPRLSHPPSLIRPESLMTIFTPALVAVSLVSNLLDYPDTHVGGGCAISQSVDEPASVPPCQSLLASVCY